MDLKLKGFLLIVFAACIPNCYAQSSTDGSYFWNVFNINYRISEKTDLLLNTKEHYSNQVDRVDFYHGELTLYRKLGPTFSMGLGYRQTGNYRSEQWSGGHNYLLYGVHLFQRGSIKIKIANRFVYKTFRHSETQYALDNISNVDFFTRSVSWVPKPYYCHELFTEIKTRKIQNIRLYGGLHVLKSKYVGFDLFYCQWFSQSSTAWNNYHVYGLATKIYLQ
ncbi:MAG: DUF2490 domain-containing protein [Verrucomicrobia bacterium]|nr:DUF2490 domain-containing protein [Prolixibacteraceae bacterium]